MADFGMTGVRIGLFQHALAHPEANNGRVRKNRSEARRASPLFVCEPRIDQGIHRSVPESRAYFDRACGVHRQSIDQLAHVQEATNGMEPSRSASTCFSENGDHQRATGMVHWESLNTGRSRQPTLGFDYQSGFAAVRTLIIEMVWRLPLFQRERQSNYTVDRFWGRRHRNAITVWTLELRETLNN